MRKLSFSILGYHPVSMPGFNGVMSLYEAKWLSRFGHDVTVFHPFKDKDHLEEVLTKNKIRNLDDLPRYGGCFDIIPIFRCEPKLSGAYDIGIWQSYHQEDSVFNDSFYSSNMIRAKNIPKLIPFEDYTSNGYVCRALDKFDMTGISLRDDLELLRKNEAGWEKYQSKVFWSPRGADSELLHPYEKSLHPTIAIDTPGTADGGEPDKRSIIHLLKAIEIVRKTHPKLEVVARYNKAFEGFEISRLPFLRFDEFYKRFFNKSWIYATFNFEYSSAQTKARVQKENTFWRTRGVYELQNVEAQMAGACLLSHEDNIIPELYKKDVSALIYSDFNDVHGIAGMIVDAIDRQLFFARGAREFALKHHDWEACIRVWEEAFYRKMAGR